MKIQIDEADLRSVLEKLETAYCNDPDCHDGYYKDGITICEQALAEQPAKPWVGLTDEQRIDEMLKAGFERNSLGWTFTYGRIDYHLLKFARAVEAKLKEKNCG